MGICTAKLTARTTNSIIIVFHIFKTAIIYNWTSKYNLYFYVIDIGKTSLFWTVAEKISQTAQIFNPTVRVLYRPYLGVAFDFDCLL
jgi:hypothetical protein